VIRVSADMAILDLNPSAELMLGYASAEVAGQPIENILIGPMDIPQSLDTARQIGHLYTLGDVRLYRRDGKTFLAHLRLLPLMSGGQLDSWAVLLQDLSQEEQHRLRTQQLEQRALLGEVTAIFAHEVRNPINNISTGLQLMAMNLPPGDPNQAMLTRVQQDCDRLADLMKSVLTFARPKEYKLETLAVEPYLQQILERWHPRLRRSKVEYTLQVEPGTPAIEGDIRALEQVFTNLITNSVQAMGDHGGRLSLKARLAPQENESAHVAISVADTGPGIPDEIRERLFEPFFTTKSGGTGLGLPITKQIITAHRGTIQVTSVPGGTVFQIILPASRQSEVV
jgi:PAS domain S-box-containing protein